MGIYRCICRDLGIPVVEISAVNGGIPAFEGITGLGRVSRFLCLVVFLYSLSICQRSRSIFVYEVYGVCRSDPLGVQCQVVRRHRSECISCRKTGVRLPATPGVVVVYTTLGLRRSPVVGGVVDAGIEFDVLDGIEFRTAVEVFDYVGFTVVIEV